MDPKFTEEDVKKVIEFLNNVAVKAEFKMNTQDIIKYFGLLSHMQKVVVPKLQAHILEIVDVVEDEFEEESGEGE
jgi:uncharacterized protein YktA (UPF0223 family)